MKNYSTFLFDSFDFDPREKRIELKYSLDGEINFTETLTLPKDLALSDYDPQTLGRALFALHLAGGVSYYKTCLPKKIEIKYGNLTQEQAAFWDSVYENGLGEFFYKNDIDFRGLINFPYNPLPPNSSNRPSTSSGQPERVRTLVPIGGGKDSTVTMELLRAAGHDITLFRLGQHAFIEEIAKIAGLPIINIKRALAPELFDLNAAGALNGHVPITAYVSCLTVVLSILYGFDAVAMSNERSASEGNVEFHGKQINHQWSKSLEFERAFQIYLRDFVTPDVSYFSLLRPFSELKIVELFSKYPKYFNATTSCNTNWKILAKKNPDAAGLQSTPKGAWCCDCPKCAFVFALLAAFLPKKTLLEMFGRNVFENEALMTIYKELFGLEGTKPFECVGTPEETSAAFLLAHKRGDLEGTPVMKLFVDKVLPTIKNPDALIKAMLTVSDDHAIPPAFVSVIS